MNPNPFFQFWCFNYKIFKKKQVTSEGQDGAFAIFELSESDTLYWYIWIRLLILNKFLFKIKKLFDLNFIIMNSCHHYYNPKGILSFVVSYTLIKHNM